MPSPPPRALPPIFSRTQDSDDEIQPAASPRHARPSRRPHSITVLQMPLSLPPLSNDNAFNHMTPSGPFRYHQNRAGVRIDTDQNYASTNSTINATGTGPNTTSTNLDSGHSSQAGKPMEFSTPLPSQTLGLPIKLGWKSRIDGRLKLNKSSIAASRTNMKAEINDNESATPNSTSNKKARTTTVAKSLNRPPYPIPVIDLSEVPTAGHGPDNPVRGSEQVVARPNATKQCEMPVPIPMPPYISDPSQENGGDSEETKPRCEICGVGQDGSYGSGRFCSSRCARTMGGIARMKKKEPEDKNEGTKPNKTKKRKERKKKQDNPKASKKSSWLTEMMEKHIANLPKKTGPAAPTPEIVPRPVQGAAGVLQEHERVQAMSIACDGAPRGSSSMRTKAVIGVGSTTEQPKVRREVKKKQGGIPIKALLNPETSN